MFYTSVEFLVVVARLFHVNSAVVGFKQLNLVCLYHIITSRSCLEKCKLVTIVCGRILWNGWLNALCTAKL